MYGGILSDVQKCVQGIQPSRVPFFANSEEFDVRWAGAVYSDYNSDAKVMADCQIKAVRHFDYDWAWLQVDDCIEFEVLGVGVKGSGNILPATCDYLPPTYETLNSLKMPNPQRDGRMPVLLEAIKRVKDALGDDVLVVGRVAAPFSSVTLLYGMTESLLLLYDDPQLFIDTARFMTDMQSRFGRAQLEAGADALWLGDCNASGHLISVQDYIKYAAQPVRACVDAYHDAGGLVFYHASEHQPGHITEQIKTGADIVSVGPGVDIRTAKDCVTALGAGCINGNLDPINVLLNGDPDMVRRETQRIIEAGKKDFRFVFNAGEMIPRDTPIENMLAMASAAREYGRF